MYIRSITLEGFRNLTAQKLELNAKFNLIIGANASGKTSFLEALYFLSRLKSFRSQDIGQLIQVKGDYFRVIAELKAEDEALFVGIERNSSELKVRVNGENLERRSFLAKKLPVLFLGPETGRLLMDSPRFRRQFLDWGLFHTEQNYHHLWQNYERALKQRNAALKSKANDGVLESIEIPLARYGEALSQLREQFVAVLFAQALPLLQRLISGDKAWSIHFRRGFSGPSLVEDLSNARMRDRIMGFTRHGPHRNDFELKVDGQSVEAFLSRGQIKLASIALMLAQIHLYQAHDHTATTLLLMDDMTAELDKAHRSFLLEEFLRLNAQLFITCLEKNEFPELIDFKLNNHLNCYELYTGLLQKVV